MKIFMNGWTALPPGEDLPKAAIKWAGSPERKVFQYHGEVVAVFFKGDIETTNDWIIVTDDGGSYKHGAKYMIWSNTYVLCRWSDATMIQLVNDLMAGNPPKDDPEYET